MNMVKNIVYLSLSLACISCAALDQAAKKYISKHIGRYERPLTVLEVRGGNLEPYSVEAIRVNSDVSYNILFFEPSNKIISTIKRERPKSLTVMSPKRLKASMIHKLSRCEQPDLVIVDAVPKYFKDATDDFITLFLSVGDYLAVDIQPEDIEMFDAHKDSPLLLEMVPHKNGDGGFLAFFKTEKKGLPVPRWTSSCKSNDIKYFVQSSFSSKSMFKKDLKTRSTWHKGINLMTFVYLDGVYPSDGVIVSEAKALSRLNHNDLVMGNLLIQGAKLKAIDFNDKRHDISVERCLDAFLGAFEKGRTTFKTPQSFHEYYRRLLDE